MSDDEKRLKALAQDHFRNSERLAKRCAQHEARIERLEASHSELVAGCTALLQLVAEMQAAMVGHLIPDGIDKDDFIYQIIGLLDGPEQRAAEDIARAAIAHAKALEGEAGNGAS